MNAYLQSKYILSFETLIYRTKLAFGNLWPELNPIPTTKKSYVKDLPWAESAHV